MNGRWGWGETAAVTERCQRSSLSCGVLLLLFVVYIYYQVRKRRRERETRQAARAERATEAEHQPGGDAPKSA